MALTTSQKPKYPTVINGGVGTISASSNTVTMGSDTNGATIYTAGAYGGVVDTLLGETDDTVTVNVFLYILDGATVKPVGMVNVPLSSGNTNAARFPVDFLDGANLPGLPINSAGKRYIRLKANEVLKCGALANLTAAKKCYVTASGLDFAD